MSLPYKPPNYDWVVGRPAKVGEVIDAIEAGRTRTASLVIGLHGEGGFGKTTLAEMVCAESRVQQLFPGRIYWVRMGPDIKRPGEVAGRVHRAISDILGEDSRAVTPDDAGSYLHSVLDKGPWRLLVIDDVWFADQITNFITGARRCVFLVTTRDPSLFAGEASLVQVGQMSNGEAVTLLSSGLGGLDQEVCEKLLTVTDQCALLLRLSNSYLRQAAMINGVSRAAAGLLQKLQEDGPAGIDSQLGEMRHALNVGRSGERARAFQATIEASTDLLESQVLARGSKKPAKERFKELGVFPANEPIPLAVIGQLWKDMRDSDVESLCTRLSKLGLVSAAGPEVPGIVLHSVIREHLRTELGEQRRKLNRKLVATVKVQLPAQRLPYPAAPGNLDPAAWWCLPAEPGYWWHQLGTHLHDAGMELELTSLLEDLRWAAAKIARLGPIELEADLALVESPIVVSLRAAIRQARHLLRPIDPPHALADILSCRLRLSNEVPAHIVDAFIGDLPSTYRLAYRWGTQVAPHPALQLTLIGLTDQIGAAVFAPDGTWIAACSREGRVQIWDATTGDSQERSDLPQTWFWELPSSAAAQGPDNLRQPSHSIKQLLGRSPSLNDIPVSYIQINWGAQYSNWANGLDVAPDGSWIATGSVYGGSVLIIDPASGDLIRLLDGPHELASQIAIGPDGTWLAVSTHMGKAVNILDAATGEIRHSLAGHNLLRRLTEGSFQIHNKVEIAVSRNGDSRLLATADVDNIRVWDVISGELLRSYGGSATTALAVAPDGTWLAAGSADGDVTLWGMADGTETRLVREPGPEGKLASIAAIAIFPDSKRLALASGKTIEIWAATGAFSHSLVNHGNWVNSLAVSPNGKWLAAGSADGTVHTWDVGTGMDNDAEVIPRDVPPMVTAIAAAPDGAWLVTGDENGLAQIRDASSGEVRHSLTGHTEWVGTVAVAGTGEWLATGSEDDTARIWTAADGTIRHILRGHTAPVVDVAISPDSTWLVTAGQDHTARIWNAATGEPLHVLKGHAHPVNAVAVAPSGRWLVTAGGDATAAIWSADGTLRHFLDGHSGPLHAVAVSPDSRWVATVGRDGTTWIWEADVGEAWGTFKAHHDWVTSIAFDPTGRWVATASRDGTAAVLDLESGEGLGGLARNNDWVTGVAFDPTGQWLATASRDGTLRIWTPGKWACIAAMRIDSQLNHMSWLKSTGICTAGSAGTFLFNFVKP